MTQETKITECKRKDRKESKTQETASYYTVLSLLISKQYQHMKNKIHI